MKRVLFVDPCCPKPYDTQLLDLEGMGGTEATVIRVADALSDFGSPGHTNSNIVVVEQHNRTVANSDSGTYYMPPNNMEHPDTIVCLRDPSLLPTLRERAPNAKLILWLHDIVIPEVSRQWQTIKDTRTQVVCVSDYHKQQATDAFKTMGYEGGIKISRIYNPISDMLIPTGVYDKHKLVFFSSPHKGLEYALRVFDYTPEHFYLYLANPGYFPDSDTKSRSRVINLGSIPHEEVMKHVSNSLCVFYPNYTFPETFGLVLAEANALGTPVITHAIGAAREVLDHPGQLTDCRNPQAVIDKVVAWSKGDRPTVLGKPEFRLKEVMKEWKKII